MKNSYKSFILTSTCIRYIKEENSDFKYFQKGQQGTFRKVNKELSERSTKNFQKGQQRTRDM